MKTIEKILEPLNLIYYEYDKRLNILRLDSNWLKEHIYKEFIKITFTLSKYNIPFFIDKHRSIILNRTNKISYFFNNYLYTLINNIKISRMNIYSFSDKKVKWAKNIEILDVEVIDNNIDLSKYDAIVFTSKNAINSINNSNPNWKNIPSYVMSPQSAKLVKHLGGKLAYIGKEKTGNEYAYELVDKLVGKNVLYLRGSKVVSNLINIFNINSIKCDDYIVYKTKTKKIDKKIKFPKNSTFIFSSPSIIKSFFENFQWQDSYKAICIGKTTAEFLPKNIDVHISDDTSINSCVYKAIEINS